MGSKELRTRGNWQNQSGAKANNTEAMILEIISYALGSDYTVEAQPKDFRHIYEGVELPEDVLDKIFTPKKSYTHGIKMDGKITNNKTGKSIFIEIKRQDGWVEEGARAAGRGNAHERSNKYFTPGLMKLLREKTKITDEDFLPFMVIFDGDITRDPARVREVTYWYQEFKDNYHFIRDGEDGLASFVINKIKPRLESNVK